MGEPAADRANLQLLRRCGGPMPEASFSPRRTTRFDSTKARGLTQCLSAESCCCVRTTQTVNNIRYEFFGFDRSGVFAHRDESMLLLTPADGAPGSLVDVVETDLRHGFCGRDRTREGEISGDEPRQYEGIKTSSNAPRYGFDDRSRVQVARANARGVSGCFVSGGTASYAQSMHQSRRQLVDRADST